jgi:4-amino-4-deoxy-L-arabinose transferase-like glycosyltransferase
VTAPRFSEPKRLVAPFTAILGTVGMVLWMANREPFARGPLWGALLALVTTAAWVAWVVPTLGRDPRSWRDTPFSRRDGERISPAKAAGLALLVLVLGGSIGGYEALPATILLALLCLVPPALRRPGLAIIVIVAAIYLPFLGASSLWDPWETHYGEVAREILARNDWISLWWAQDKWFWSKPVLLFWMEAWTMGALGVGFMPDANPAHPEWALRLPSALMALGALAILYATLRKSVGTRAASLAVLVTATMPQFFFISHQAITDLPLVAAMTIACCFLLLAIAEDPDREAAVFQIGPWRVSFQHVVIFALIAMVLPQATYLISRNLSFVDGYGWVAHPDRFLYGSAGNVDVPGNPSPRDQLPHVHGFLGQPFLQGLAWLGALGALVRSLRQERRARVLYMVAFYLSCAIAFMAKGLAGLAIPGAAALFYLVASRDWKLLADGQLRVSRGVLIVSVVSLPWYLAMYVRHGSAFTNRLLIHDHINRLAAGVHGDTGTIAYFATQIGYAMFPWIAFAPLALLGFALGRTRSEDADRQRTTLFLAMWILSSFTLFSAMVTKFHHYILPAIVPAGALIGIALAELWGPKRPRATWLAVASGACLTLGFAWLIGDPRGIVPAGVAQADDWVLRQAEPARAYALVALGALLAWIARLDIERAETHLQPASWQAAVGVALLLGACAIAFVGRDLSWATSARPQGNERMIHLFVYNYERAWPGHLDYRSMFCGFALAAGVLVALSGARRWRSVAVRAVAGVAIAFSVWGLDVYMTDLATHWSVRELAARYYEERTGPDEPLLAWQMNWKGENFYTGNRVYVFAETDNKRIKKWISKNEGRRVYVVLEHKRLSRLETLLPGREIEALSTPRDNNKFVLVTLEI